MIISIVMSSLRGRNSSSRLLRRNRAWQHDDGLGDDTTIITGGRDDDAPPSTRRAARFVVRVGFVLIAGLAVYEAAGMLLLKQQREQQQQGVGSGGDAGQRIMRMPLGSYLGDLLRIQQQPSSSTAPAIITTSSLPGTSTKNAGTAAANNETSSKQQQPMLSTIIRRAGAADSESKQSSSSTLKASSNATTTTHHKNLAAVLSHPRADQSAISLFRSQSPDSKFAVFYNFYMSTIDDVNKRNETFVDAALRIVQEQMDQVGQSTVHKRGEKFTLYYNTIGRRNGLNASYMHRHCEERNELHCQFLRHYDKGFEEVTLQRIYEYCHLYPDHRAVYLHSKGSYHFLQANEMMRKYMTEAVMHEKCIHPPDDSCNVCGLLFQPIWMPMFPGNFWTAHCSYINKLIPPADFEKATKVALQGAVPENTLEFTANMYSGIGAWNAGFDRYAMEAWVASHPSVLPCHFSQEARVRFWVKDGHDTSKIFRWHIATEKELLKASFYMMKKNKLMEIVVPNETIRFREYFLLAGKLHKWMRLYGDKEGIPPPDSWIWKFFPDGDAWQKAIARYGNRTVEVVVTLAKENRLKEVLV